MNDCERYNLETKRWEVISSLNIAWCTANAFIMKNQLMVAGGYTRKSVRTKTIEVYNEDKDIWFACGV